MSDVPSSDVHSVFVAAWENKFDQKLSLVQKVQLYEKAINAIDCRARTTLSSVTLLVILDRVLKHSEEKHPILSYITIDYQMKINDHHKIKEDDLNELLKALRFFLIELLRVFGRLTAEILSTPLHNELLKVTWTELEKK